VLKSRLALIFAAIGLVLTFFITVGKLITPGSLVLRYLVNIALFYGVGVGLDYFFRKYAVPALKQEADAKNDLSAVLSTERRQEAGKGARLDLTVDGPVDASGAPSQPPAEGAPGGEAGETGGEKAGTNPLGPHKDFEIQDEFIIINDKKMKNDPKLMASAIKTKLGE